MRFVLLIFCLLFSSYTPGQSLRFEYAPMHYHTRPVTNGISVLSTAALQYEPEQGYLKSVLNALNISKESQVLVFSSTSFQKDKITPQNPRAIYFNDTGYVGWIPGADLLEIISIDPYLGPIFYDIRQEPASDIEIHRNNRDCLDCHSSAKTQSVPGLFIRSSYPKGGGRVAGRTTSHQTEIAERWGGWYVTGETGDMQHRGNRPGLSVEEAEDNRNLSDLSSFFDTSLFLTPHSDVLALMVLEHQCHTFNLINRANYRVRLVMHDEGLDSTIIPPDVPDRVEREIKRHAPALVRNLMFTNEAELKAAVKGNTGFADHFSSLGPYDNHGRSLREIDGTKRLFKYPCSYMIYTDSFKMLPPVFLREVYRMLKEILTDPEPDEAFTHLSESDRKAVYEILKATVPELAESW